MFNDLKRFIGVKTTEWGCSGTGPRTSVVQQTDYSEICTLEGDTYTIGRCSNGWLVTNIFTKTRDDGITVEYIYPFVKHDIMVKVDKVFPGGVKVNERNIKEGPIPSHVVKSAFTFNTLLGQHSIDTIWKSFDSIFSIELKATSDTTAVIHIEGIVNMKGFKLFDFHLKRKTFKRCKLAYVKKKAMVVSKEDFLRDDEEEVM